MVLSKEKNKTGPSCHVGRGRIQPRPNCTKEGARSPHTQLEAQKGREGFLVLEQWGGGRDHVRHQKNQIVCKGKKIRGDSRRKNSSKKDPHQNRAYLHTPVVHLKDSPSPKTVS